MRRGPGLRSALGAGRLLAQSPGVRLKLTIAYDGRTLAGWQSQPEGNTVQDLIEKAIAETAKRPVRIHGSGRTDAGVHALGQIAHFDASIFEIDLKGTSEGGA